MDEEQEEPRPAYDNDLAPVGGFNLRVPRIAAARTLRVKTALLGVSVQPVAHC